MASLSSLVNNTVTALLAVMVAFFAFVLLQLWWIPQQGPLCRLRNDAAISLDLTGESLAGCFSACQREEAEEEMNQWKVAQVALLRTWKIKGLVGMADEDLSVLKKLSASLYSDGACQRGTDGLLEVLALNPAMLNDPRHLNCAKKIDSRIAILTREIEVHQSIMKDCQAGIKPRGCSDFVISQMLKAFGCAKYVLDQMPRGPSEHDLNTFLREQLEQFRNSTQNPRDRCREFYSENKEAVKLLSMKDDANRLKLITDSMHGCQ